ncbi:cryptochrome/deoxyribodipyrimidine photo-lyase family protein [Pseudovibrio sp. SPO723]|uniref:cryptochrome/deoxyribodipyrimidine photo-lyase family protein n=1 Tax=Nesiotobacter zosterae TaxID=392721 RepID=UPI0029C5E06A|nr:FAD-binding domain-containing protein [Pseudovibrio sp. SPO723]MDX5593232.1 FAD-binding domain-containing protein [Pseudovibrio sp. SPO723]
MELVWFKRDLRVDDHAPLFNAAQRGPVLPVYIVEPELWAQPDASARQWAFVTECLEDLDTSLRNLGQPLLVQFGDVVEVFTKLQRTYQFERLWSHEETGNGWSYARDKKVSAWCKARNIPWYQLPQFGVIRGLKDRSGWSRRWDRVMGEPAAPAPKALAPVSIDGSSLPRAQSLGLVSDPCQGRQIGGRVQGLRILNSFLFERAGPYRKAMSSPLTAENSCSRLSTYLAYGCISMREVAQATWNRQLELKQMTQAPEGWRGALASFSGRLHWHCHFMQKLEDAPSIETRNLHRAYNGLRTAENVELLKAWQKGETGFPFVDACMRYLRVTGWMNFRMRAMLMAFASYHLWLDWRQPGLHLARQFVDYEPGIHWPQVQMQSGTTGINTIRIYNPVKQGYDQDPSGAFVRRWIPELREVPDNFLQEPWKWEGAGQVLDKSYPLPIVDHMTAAKEARQKLWAVRKGEPFRSQANAIQQKHGSRRSGIAQINRRTTKAANSKKNQMSFPFD